MVDARLPGRPPEESAGLEHAERWRRAVASANTIRHYFSREIDSALRREDEEAVAKYRALWNDIRRVQQLLGAVESETR